MTIATLKALCSRMPWCEPAVLESVLELALEIAREGREGRRIGTLFTVGKADEVLAASRALILDPLAGHAPARTHIGDPDLRFREGLSTQTELLDARSALASAESIRLEAARSLGVARVRVALLPALPVANASTITGQQVLQAQQRVQQRAQTVQTSNPGQIP